MTLLDAATVTWFRDEANMANVIQNANGDTYSISDRHIIRAEEIYAVIYTGRSVLGIDLLTWFPESIVRHSYKLPDDAPEWVRDFPEAHMNRPIEERELPTYNNLSHVRVPFDLATFGKFS